MTIEAASNQVEMAKVQAGNSLKFLWYSDLYRYAGTVNCSVFLRHLLREPGFRYSFFLRLCNYLAKRKTKLVIKIIYRLAFEILRQIGVRYGISIPPGTEIGSGLLIGHHGGIVVNSETIIGNNCNMSHGVTIGQTNRGSKKGCPTIGNAVFIGPGAVIIGKIKIGNNVAIGANAVVSKDIPDNAVVVGIPGEVISLHGSQDYIHCTDYEKNTGLE